jgi:hypothetical protein
MIVDQPSFEADDEGSLFKLISRDEIFSKQWVYYSS